MTDAQFEEAFRLHMPGLRRAVARLSRDTDDALLDDAISFAWLQLWRHRERVGPEQARAWLLTVAKREAWELFRQAGCWEELQACHEPPCRSGELRREALAALEALADVTTERTRATLALHIAGHSYEQIAAARGITKRQVDRHVRKARSGLRALQAAA